LLTIHIVKISHRTPYAILASMSKTNSFVFVTPSCCFNAVQPIFSTYQRTNSKDEKPLDFDRAITLLKLQNESITVYNLLSTLEYTRRCLYLVSFSQIIKSRRIATSVHISPSFAMAKEDRDHVAANLRRSREQRATRGRVAPARLEGIVPEAQHGKRNQGAQLSLEILGPLLAVQERALEIERHQGAQPRPGAVGTLLSAQQEQARRQRRQEKVSEIVVFYRGLQAQAQADQDAQNRHQQGRDQVDQVARGTENRNSRPHTRSQNSTASSHSDLYGDPSPETVAAVRAIRRADEDAVQAALGRNSAEDNGTSTSDNVGGSDVGGTTLEDDREIDAPGSTIGNPSIASNNERPHPALLYTRFMDRVQGREVRQYDGIPQWNGDFTSKKDSSRGIPSSSSTTRPGTRSQTSAVSHHSYHSNQREAAREAADEQRLTQDHVVARNAFEEQRVTLIDQKMEGLLGTTPNQVKGRRGPISRDFVAKQGKTYDRDSAFGDDEIDSTALERGDEEPANDDDKEHSHAEKEESDRLLTKTTTPQQTEPVAESARNSSRSHTRKRTVSWGSRNFRPSPSKKLKTKSHKPADPQSRHRAPSQLSWHNSSSSSSAPRTPSPFFTRRSHIPQETPREAEVNISLHTTYDRMMKPRRRVADATEDGQSAGDYVVERERGSKGYKFPSHFGAISASGGGAVVTNRDNLVSDVEPGLKFGDRRIESAGALSPSTQTNGHQPDYNAYDEMQEDEDARHQFMQEQFGQGIADFNRHPERQNEHEQSKGGDKTDAHYDFYQAHGVRSSPAAEDMGQQDTEARSASTPANARSTNDAYAHARATSTAHARMRGPTSRHRTGNKNLDHDGTGPELGSNQQLRRSDRLRSVSGSSRVISSSSMGGRSNLDIGDMYKGRRVTRVVILRPGESILVKFVPEKN
jgi:hypothetical protein